MAKNIVHEDGNQLGLVCTAPTTPVSGDPVLVGTLPGVALTDKDTTTNQNTVKLNGTARLVVKGVAASAANTAIAVGDVIYYKVGATPVLNVDNTGVRYGVALEAVASGATSTGTLVRIGY